MENTRFKRAVAAGLAGAMAMSCASCMLFGPNKKEIVEAADTFASAILKKNPDKILKLTNEKDLGAFPDLFEEDNYSEDELKFFDAVGDTISYEIDEESVEVDKDEASVDVVFTMVDYEEALKDGDYADIDEVLDAIEECDDMEKYRLWGELITANLYRIPNKNIEEITVENYYDNNNKLTIKLDKKYLPSINAKRFFKKYSKLKNALEVVSKQKKETLRELNYIESIVYEIESSTTIDELTLIFDEISENDIFKERTEKTKQNKKNKIKKSKLTKNKEVSFNPIKYKIGNYTVLVGRNNVENDYLTLKYARKTDLWFHTKDFHGSHTILKIDNNLPYPSQDILIKVAEIAAKHSKAKNSSNVPVDYCEVKYVKKPSGSRPGMVIYTNNKTLNVNP